MKKFFLSVKNPQENYKWEKLPRKITQPRLIFLYLLTDGGWLVVVLSRRAACCSLSGCCGDPLRQYPPLHTLHGRRWQSGKYTLIKGTAQRFRYLIFSSIEHSWATNQGVELCSILVQISASYSNFSKAPRGIRPRGVDLPGVTNPKF